MTEAAAAVETATPAAPNGAPAAAPAPAAANEPAKFDRDALLNETPDAAAPATIDIGDKPAPSAEQKVLNDFRKEQAARKKAETDFGELKSKHEQSAALLERLAKDPVLALKHAGLTPQAFVDKIIAKEVAAAPEYPPEIQEMLAHYNELKAKDARDKAAEKAAQARAEGIAAFTEELGEYGEKHPVLGAMVTPEVLYLAREQIGGGIELDAFLAQAEESNTQNIVAALSSPKAAAVIFANEKVQAALQQIGLTNPAASRPSGTRSSNGAPAPNPVTAVHARQEIPDEELTQEARIAAAIKAAERDVARRK